MAAIANSIDFVAELLQGTTENMKCIDRTKLRGSVLCCYAGFALFWLYVWGAISSMMFSVLLTMASCVTCLGFAILTLRVHGSKSVKGISSRMLEMYVWYLTSRLTATCLKNGYIPVDRTGDHVFQLCDMCTLALVLHLLYCMHRQYAHTYEDDKDTFSIRTLVVPCFVLAYFVHGHHNRSLFFDTCWAFSTNLEALVMVPQLWMMCTKGGKVDALMGHFVACTVLAGAMTCLFWSFNFRLLEKHGPTKSGKVLIAAHILKLVLGGDFSYYYIKAFFRGESVVLPNREGELSY
jgi:ER lumen protein retaining receptor